ncbi:MAG: hypothetical protein A2452_11265 [Candidatus Firestonebacteria bacterium RIFOXYC2_FULL_39_67]|nr:MAG: hypothetical protein A2452_11265 [Candidatus Firestonebacteria bacterium RIFOXYC2_FULL_39_67]
MILILIVILVLTLPLLFKRIEEALEIFLLIMGLITLTITSQWSLHLIKEILLEPIKITITVFVAGILFNIIQKTIENNIGVIADKIGVKLFVFLLVVGLGFLSSIVTAIIAALILVEIINILKFSRNAKIKIAVLACFSIGFGAVLTPIGEPLSAIIVSKLKGHPHFADFWFLLTNLWYFVIPAIIFIGFIASKIAVIDKEPKDIQKQEKHETLGNIFYRSLKVYVFVAGLVCLGVGLRPLIDLYLSNVSIYAIYWINITSAFLDNATLGAAEIGPALSLPQIKAAVLALIISGGMLIPGNIPNIITANKLGIGSKEWLKIGVPFGLVLLIVYFIIIVVINHI